MGLIWLLAGLSACAQTSAGVDPIGPERASPSRRVVAVGDVHGDLQAATRALRLAGVVDEKSHWVGGETVVIQVGDQLDRGDDEQEILDWFERLAEEAAAQGGAFHALLGNHEIMNVALDFRYVTPGGFADFVASDPAGLAGVPAHAQGRVEAFRPGGTYANLLSGHLVTVKVDRSLFVHGGVLPEHVAYGLDRLNEETALWLRGQRGMPALLRGEDAPIWTRAYSQEAERADCQKLSEVLASLDVDRMVVAHTVQREGINAACGGKVWRVDVGLAAHYGGSTQVLEIVGDQVRVLGNAAAQ